MSRLVLHIGTHKTATTSIQRFFRSNHQAFEARGVYYPDYRLIGCKPHYAHLGMANALSGAHPKLSFDDARRFFAEVRARAADHDVTVISGEPFYRHVAVGRKVDMPADPDAYWCARREYVARVAEITGATEVAVVFRQQADYAQSLYQEQVKVTRYRHGFKAFLGEFWFHFAFLAQAETWNSAVPRVRALGFEHLRETGDIPGAFCAALGIDASGLPRPPRLNESLLPDLVILKRMLHATGHDRDELRDRVDRLDRLIEDDDLRGRLARRSFFDNAAALRGFQEGFARDNVGLLRFMPALPPGQNAFPAPATEGRLFGDRLHPEFLDLLSRHALQSVAG